MSLRLRCSFLSRRGLAYHASTLTSAMLRCARIRAPRSPQRAQHTNLPPMLVPRPVTCFGIFLGATGLRLYQYTSLKHTSTSVPFRCIQTRSHLRDSRP